MGGQGGYPHRTALRGQRELIIANGGPDSIDASPILAKVEVAQKLAGTGSKKTSLCQENGCMFRLTHFNSMLGSPPLHRLPGLPQELHGRLLAAKLPIPGSVYQQAPHHVTHGSG